jgi:hypothetical protein
MKLKCHRFACMSATLFSRQFDAAGASPRWLAMAIMGLQLPAALATRSVSARKCLFGEGGA